MTTSYAHHLGLTSCTKKKTTMMNVTLVVMVSKFAIHKKTRTTSCTHCFGFTSCTF